MPHLLMYVEPRSMPSAVRIGRSLRDRWHRPKASEDNPRAAHVGIHLVSEVSRKPRNTAWRGPRRRGIRTALLVKLVRPACMTLGQ